MEKHLFRTEELDMYLQSKNSVVIYGGAKYARRLIDYMILNQKAVIIEAMVVTRKDETNCGYKGIMLREASSFFEERGKCSVLIAASAIYQDEIAQIVSEYVQDYRFVADELFFDMGRKLNISYRGINFIVGGFFKCGTTSLHRAFMEIDDIYLSDRKESQFFSWYDKVEDPKKKLEEKYFSSVQEGQIVGMIEPSFMFYAKEVYDFFGDDVKLIFLVRNPVEALFSKFKMDNRSGLAGLEEFYQKIELFSLEMFDMYFQRDGSKEIFEYVKWIEKFEKYYPKEQIKIVLFEELIKNSQTVIQDILEYIGVSCRYERVDFPSANEGNYVMADAAGYKLAKQRYDLKCEIRFSDTENGQEKRDRQIRYAEITKAFNNAPKIWDLKMTDKQRSVLEEYYFDSVKGLEAMMNRDLSKLWFK
ncbi:MAG: sulfotransferase [Lachnospiraceae bacterium]|nr:sulfotransferase [Lachnospiraceae bacterium]